MVFTEICLIFIKFCLWRRGINQKFWYINVQILCFSLCIFIEKKNNFFVQFSLFFKSSYLDNFYSFACIIHLYRFYHNVYPSHVQVFNVLPLIFLQKYLVCAVSFFCKFSYLDQFYSFLLAIIFIIFSTIFIGHTSKILSFFLCIFYRNKFSLMRIPIWVEMFENMKLRVTFVLDPKAS